MALNHEPNVVNQDAFYAELIRGQQDLSDEQADMMLAKFALTIANHIGAHTVLSEASDLARPTTQVAAK